MPRTETSLAPAERRFFEALTAASPGVVTNRLLAAVFGTRFRHYVSSLRQQMPTGWEIVSVRGVGWRAVRIGAVAAAMLAAGRVMAAPPPAGSPDDEAMKPYGEWITHQQVPHIGGACCDSSDGRIVDARVNDRTGLWEVRFVHPEDITQPEKPVAGKWYEVPADAVLHSANPSGIPIAWWYPALSALQHGSPVRCFAPGSSS